MARPNRKTRAIHRRAKGHPTPGSPPGTLLADPDAPIPEIRVIAYGPDDFVEQDITDLGTIPGFLERWPVTWVNVDGLGNVEVIQRLGEIFGLHRLSIEDVVHVRQRPKVEDYESHVFIVTQMARRAARLETEQISLFLGRNFVLTFQERRGDCFDPIRERVRKGRGRVRESGAGYLAYALVDATIDTHFPILEAYGELVDELEAEVLAAPRGELIRRIHDLKIDLISLRRAIWPQRDMVNALIRDVPTLIDEQTRVHLRDCYDHTVQLLDILETYREIASGLIEVYLSGMSSRTNEIMKVLTIIATIFIPLSFVAGVYGMNFDPRVSPWNMPELAWRWGYPFALGIMAAVAAGLLLYFRRRGWIGPPARTPRQRRD